MPISRKTTHSLVAVVALATALAILLLLSAIRLHT